MVHGNPVSGYVYHKLMRLLQGEYRLLVPDLLGFGLSDKPPDEKDYSLVGHIEIIAEFIRALDVREAVLVGHDWGGPIGFGAAISESQRFSHLVALNTLTESPMTIMPMYWLPYHLLLRLRPLSDYLFRQRNLFQRLGVSVMDEQDREVFFRANHSPQTRAGIAAFPRMIPTNAAHPNYEILDGVLQGVQAWQIPSLVLFSDHDSVFSADQGRRFAARLQHARFQLIPGPKHFLQYEAPQAVAAEIGSFLTG